MESMDQNWNGSLIILFVDHGLFNIKVCSQIQAQPGFTGVPQGRILGLALIMIHFNDVYKLYGSFQR